MTTKKTEPTPIFFVYECGCELRRHQLLTQNINGNLRTICPEHQTFLVKRKRQCNNPDCGEWFDGNKSSFMSLVCKECRKKIIRVKNRLFMATNLKLIEKHSEELERLYGYHDRKMNYEKPVPKIRVDTRKGRNIFDCKNFSLICGFCVLPHFTCKLYKAA